jgi:hypothetical protein
MLAKLRPTCLNVCSKMHHASDTVINSHLDCACRISAERPLVKPYFPSDSLSDDGAFVCCTGLEPMRKFESSWGTGTCGDVIPRQGAEATSLVLDSREMSPLQNTRKISHMSCRQMHAACHVSGWQITWGVDQGLLWGLHLNGDAPAAAENALLGVCLSQLRGPHAWGLVNFSLLSCRSTSSCLRAQHSSLGRKTTRSLDEHLLERSHISVICFVKCCSGSALLLLLLAVQARCTWARHT